MGNVVSVKNNGINNITVVVINNRVIEVQQAEQDVNFSVGEQVQVVYENDEPIIRKL